MTDKKLQIRNSNAEFLIKDDFNSGEQDEISTIRKFLIVQKEGNRSVSREIDHYNLEIIIALG
jgi:hypothetical protein